MNMQHVRTISPTKKGGLGSLGVLAPVAVAQLVIQSCVVNPFNTSVTKNRHSRVVILNSFSLEFPDNLVYQNISIDIVI